jgi:hypothetical protein
MKVSLQTYGGLAGGLGRPPKIVDDAQLDQTGQAQLRELVAAAIAATGRHDQSGQLRDAQTYEIVIEDDGTTTTLEATDGTVPPAFAELRDWVRNH